MDGVIQPFFYGYPVTREDQRRLGFCELQPLVLETNSKVLVDIASRLDGKDGRQLLDLIGLQWTMYVYFGSWSHAETFVVGGEEDFLQEGIGRGYVVNTGESELFHQTVLERTKQVFYSAFGLRAVGVNE